MKKNKIIDLYDDEDLLLCEDYAIDIYAGKILTEFATVQRNNRFNMCVAVNPASFKTLLMFLSNGQCGSSLAKAAIRKFIKSTIRRAFCLSIFRRDFNARSE